MTIAPRRSDLQLLSIFAIAALALALAGIYGVISYSVNQRTHEIGVRMALGAQPSDVLRMVIMDGMKPVLVGLALGILSVFALTRAVASLLFAVSASNPAALVSVTVLFCSVSLVAVIVPAHCAAKMDSLASLRTE
jgi:ABC-type antimicrobial peptide transport system permease subunit